MSLQNIIILPDNRLRQVSDPVSLVDDSIRKLMDDMLETMYDAPGIGLAAIQIAIAKRVIVCDVAQRDEGEDAEENAPPKRDPVFLVNPEITWASDEKSVYEEGCLSIPDYYAEVERPARVKVGFLNRMGERQEIEADGLLATCLQHEIDHLNGVLFIDHISRLKRERVVKKFEKEARRRG
ncbi:MAG: peptide deformylase [Beijerinckiaceae bacterium]